MFKEKTIVCVIPARLESSRFPRKILASLAGKPLIQWVWEAARKVSLFDQVIIAIDSPLTAQVIEGFGGEYVMTSARCRNGTERLIELQKRGLVKGDIWVNWQGDEPLLHEAMIRQLLATCDQSEVDVWTLRKRIAFQEEIESPHVVKVVCDERGRALYFSRSTIPHYPKGWPDKEKIYYKHCGLYAYTDAALAKIAALPPSPLAEAESLEQLTFLAHGMSIFVQPTDYEMVGIDLPEHLCTAEERLR